MTVTDDFAVNVDWSDEPTDVDLRAYWTVRETATLPEAVPIGASQAHQSEAEPEEPKPLVELLPQLEGIDSALRNTLGFGLDALTGVLNVARRWEVTPEAPVGATTSSALADEVANPVVGATAEECELALNWLTLRGTDLAADAREHWETERRAVRVTTRPLVNRADTYLVLPWTAEMTLKIVESYLSDGRLPWPAKSLPDEVNQALNRYRQRRNRQLGTCLCRRPRNRGARRSGRDQAREGVELRHRPPVRGNRCCMRRSKAIEDLGGRGEGPLHTLLTTTGASPG